MASHRPGLPTQAAPVNRAELLDTYMVAYFVGANAAGKDEFLDVAAGPEANDRAYFSSQTSPSLGVCHVLASYAVARCYRTGGLL
jgi:hypothetical protein